MFKLLPFLMISLPFVSLSAAPLTVTEPPLKSKKEEPVQENTSRSSESFFRQCYNNVPPVLPSIDKRELNQIPINIKAFHLSGLQDKLVYRDQVELTQSDKYLASDTLTYFVNQERAQAQGNVNFINGQVTLYSDSIEAKFKSDETTLYQVDYQFHGRGGRGNAKRVYDNGLDLYELNSSTYSACPPDDNTWSLSSSTLYIDNNNGVGSAYNAVLKIKDIPVFYFPYISYPISDRRKTGILFPSYGMSGSNGFTFNQPLYINIATNMDATLTGKYMEKRGTLLASEFRYLFALGSGKFQTEYLEYDKIRQQKRYLYHWDHSVNFAKNWHFNANYSAVSDDFYFSDISTPYGQRSDNQLLQTANLTYREKHWNSELEVRDFQILGNGDTPHKVLPKISFSAYQPLNWRSLQFDIYSEISNFRHDDDSVYRGTRIHLEPKLSLPLYFDSLFVNTELKYMLSFYEQTLPTENPKYDWYNNLKRSVNRYIPSFKLHSGVNFERDFSFLGSSYRQTFVPQFQYLYVPYQDQSAIGLYDTTTMQQDYYGLFRENRFSGYDRIADANQITLGISSSFINYKGQERMRLAIGQNYYFERSKVRLKPETTLTESASRSSIIGELDLNFSDDYFFHTGIEWDSDNNIIKRANSTIEKRWLYNTYAQVNYRYIALLEETNTNDLAKGQVNQLGSKINWSINSQWSSFASYYYDLEYKSTYERIIGLKYQSCCWSLGLTYDQHMLPYYGSLESIADDRQTETSFKINFELMGLGGVGFSSGGQGLFNYGRPFYLQ